MIGLTPTCPSYLVVDPHRKVTCSITRTTVHRNTDAPPCGIERMLVAAAPERKTHVTCGGRTHLFALCRTCGCGGCGRARRQRCRRPGASSALVSLARGRRQFGIRGGRMKVELSNAVELGRRPQAAASCHLALTQAIGLDPAPRRCWARWRDLLRDGPAHCADRRLGRRWTA